MAPIAMLLSRFRQNLSKSLGSLLVASGCIFVIGALQLSQLNQLKNKAKNPSLEYFQSEINSERTRLNFLNKVPVFGFDNLFADWVFLSFIQYFGDNEAREMTDYRLSPDYFEVILQHDPKFLDAYYFLSTSSSIYAAMPERSVALMDKKLKVLSQKILPKYYYVWRYKAIDELLFIGDGKAARQSFAKAAEWANLFSDSESKNAAAISRRTAEFLANNPNSKYAQVSAWAMVLSNTKDQTTRKIAISRIEALGGKIFISPDGRLSLQLPPKD